MKLKKNISSILFWSIISAAFIGPGTVTTAASAGASYGFDLIWVLVVSTTACAVLQINVTQLTIESNKTLGELLLEKFHRYKFIAITLGFSIVFGCMAYQAGNLLGASLGLGLLFELPQHWILLIIVMLASILLWFGTANFVVKILGAIVAIMGCIFVYIALSIDLNISKYSSIQPAIPYGSEILVMGLIGTTIVPYNLFLGSGLSKGKNLSVSRIGLILAIAIGGMISIAILLVGMLVTAPFNFEKLSIELFNELGLWAKYLLGLGLFSAGFTSSMTAPLAAIFTMKSIFPFHENLHNKKGIAYKSVWGTVMISGLVFGFLNIKPIPAIILAQAINGIILPFIAGFILMLVLSNSNKNTSKSKYWRIILLTMIVYLIFVLGIFNLLKLATSPTTDVIIISLLLSLILTIGLVLFSLHIKSKTDPK